MHCKKTCKDTFLCVHALNHDEFESAWVEYHLTTSYSVPTSLLSGAVNVNYHDEIKW